MNTTGTHTSEAGSYPSAARGIAALASHPLALLCGLGFLAFAANLALRWQLPLPFCALRKLTGVPCPACGSTRSLLAWTHLDPVAAFSFNPLFFLVCLGVAGWAGAWLAERISARPIISRWQTAAQRLPLLRMGLVLAAINWIYLCLALPK